MPKKEDKLEPPDMGQILFPLAGVMILVLATIIGNAQALFTNTSVQLEIPKANVIETDLEQMIPISIDKNGVYYYKDEKMNDVKELTPKVAADQKKYAEEAGDPELEGFQMVVIRGDKSIQWGSVLEAIDAVKRAKCKRVVLAVIKKRG
ncbi:MAG: ExbD/TolR family protein [candidate division WOR-3 bacterium]